MLCWLGRHVSTPGRPTYHCVQNKFLCTVVLKNTVEKDHPPWWTLNWKHLHQQLHAFLMRNQIRLKMFGAGCMMSTRESMRSNDAVARWATDLRARITVFVRVAMISFYREAYRRRLFVPPSCLTGE